MSRLEDKTLNSIRLLSDKTAAKNCGSIVSNGGAYIAKNIDCDGCIISNELVTKSSAKIAGNLSVGNVLYCPDLYGIDDDTIRFRRCLVPGEPKNPISNFDITTLGTKREPWSVIYVDCVKTGPLAVPELTVGINYMGMPSLNIIPGQINIGDYLNIIDPLTNTLIAQSGPNCINANAPIYQRWDAFNGTKIVYKIDQTIDQTIKLESSVIFLDIGSCLKLTLCCDTTCVPNNSWARIYFLSNGQSVRAKYNIKFLWGGRECCFICDKLVKKIKLVFLDCGVVYNL